eukprot:3422782-Pleurochrysis_carterae.AAC.2
MIDEQEPLRDSGADDWHAVGGRARSRDVRACMDAPGSCRSPAPVCAAPHGVRGAPNRRGARPRAGLAASACTA